MEKKYIIISGVLLIALLGILVIVKIKTKAEVEHILVSDIKTKVVENSFSLVHVGELSDEGKERAFAYKKDYVIVPYMVENNIDELNKFLSKYEDLKVTHEGEFIIFLKDKPVAVVDMALADLAIREQLDKYLHGIIPESERYYKVLSTAAEYSKKVNSKEYTIAVFGEETCSYCNLYLPVINKVAKENNLNIYYFDAENYDKSEYNKVLQLNLAIPAECTMNNQDTTLKGSFPKPMTIITKNGQEVGCIRGYVTEEVLLKKLKEFKLV